MKKSVIKRRKRVIPTALDAQGDDYSSSGEQGVSPPPDRPGSQPDMLHENDVDMERGTVNSDGSVNLGLRRRPDHTLSLVPEPVLRQGQSLQQQPSPRLLGGSDPSQYHSSPSNHASSHLPGIANEDNRLPPLTNYPSMATIQRQPSLSPASYLSPPRKRSFSASEKDYIGSVPSPSHNDGYTAFGGVNVGDNPDLNANESSSKRISSIKSILNAAADDNDDNLGSMAGPYPGIGGGLSQSLGNDHRGQNNIAHGRDEKRAALQREAERMRQMLAAKEKELAELD